MRVRDGETHVTDGPYAETKEVLGGYYLLECASIDEAVRRGRRGSRPRDHGAVEVRPVHVDPEADGGPRGCVMKYALLVYSDQTSSLGAATPRRRQAAPREESMPAWSALLRRARQGATRTAAPSSRPPREAKVVRVRDGETIVTDGPFAETKEQIGGVFITELPDLDEAIASPRSSPPRTTAPSRSDR